MKKRVFTLLFITIFVDFLSFGIVFPLLPYYVETFGASAFTIGLLAGSFSFMQFIFSPVWGRISDKVGRKPIILISLLGSSISMFGFAVSSSLFWLFITRILAGLFTAASLPTTYAYIADITEGKERAKGFGMLGAAWGLGFVFGPALGALLSNYSTAMPFFVAAGIAFGNFFLASILLPPSSIKKGGTQLDKGELFNIMRVIHNLRGDVGSLFVLFFIASFALSSLEIIFPLFAKYRFGFNQTTIGFFFTFIGVIIGLTQGVFVGKAVARLGEARTIILAHWFMIIGYLAIAFSFFLPMLFLSAAILAFGIALNEPSLAALISRRSKEGQGTTLGATWGFDSLARIAGPAVGGFFYVYSSIETPFFINALFLAVSLVILNLYLIYKRKHG